MIQKINFYVKASAMGSLIYLMSYYVSCLLKDIHMDLDAFGFSIFSLLTAISVSIFNDFFLQASNDVSNWNWNFALCCWAVSLLSFCYFFSMMIFIFYLRILNVSLLHNTVWHENFIVLMISVSTFWFGFVEFFKKNN